MGFVLSLLTGGLGRLLGWLGRSLSDWRVLIALGVAALVASNLIQMRQVDHLKADRDSWRRTSAEAFGWADAWRASFLQDKANRAQESRAAVAAVEDLDTACSSRVAAARASSAAITKIVTREPTYDASHCPVRELVPSQRLCDATGWACSPG